MTPEQIAKVEQVLKQWHEAGRADFERSYSNLNYDSPSYAKHYHVAAKYVRLDCGDSGAFMAEIATGTVYGIKGYGVPNKHKVCGNIWAADFDGASLLADRWRHGRFNRLADARRVEDLERLA
jgi:hypothetical protein